MSGWPGVTVIVPTRDRPGLLRETLASLLGHDYPGELSVIVVYDQSEPDRTLITDRVAVLVNDRKPGAAGARNAGILAATSPLVAFCDDTDLWRPGKLTAQVSDLGDAEVICCGLHIFGEDGQAYDRTIPFREVTEEILLHGHMPQLHPSGYLVRRSAGLLFSEEIPGSYGEDYEFLLRAAGRRPVRNLPVPGVDIRWHSRSHFGVADNNAVIAESARWLLARYPFSSAGYAHWAGKCAFAEAVGGRRRSALRWSLRTLRRRPWDPRAALAVLVACGVPARLILTALHRIGRGV